jgi:hypothetical protein
MKAKNNIVIYVTLVAAWIIFLVIRQLAHQYLSSLPILVSAIDGLANIPLLVLVMVFLVRLYLDDREKRIRRQQLMFMKSCMFRLEMRNLFISNFLALKSPPLTLAKIKSATLDELHKMREDANTIEYKSLELMESVIMEYVNAEPVWRNFMNISLEYGFEDIFQDMLYIMHFISDVKTFKATYPDKLFIREAAKNELLMERVVKVLGDGIRKYLDYAIELKKKQPELFSQLIADYELSTQIRG